MTQSFRLTFAALALVLDTQAAHAGTTRWSVLANGEKVGSLVADENGRAVTIHYDVKNNGRGPTIDEALELGKDGLPSRWRITGSATFGGAVNESFEAGDTTARWADTSGAHQQAVTERRLYVAQNASPWALGLYARALAKAGGSLDALPAGTLRREDLGAVSLGGKSYRAVAISGIDMSPSTILLDAKGDFFAELETGGATVREGSEALLPELTALAARLTDQRYAKMQARFAHRIDAPVRVRNVRVFDPVSGKLGDPVSVVFANGVITGVQPLDAPATPGEATVDGKGGTLLPGLHDMHAHISLQSAMLYLAAGVTSVRDMGNTNAVLADLVAKFDSGALGGPRVVRNGFVEGRSPYSARLGIVVDSEAAALDAVRWYAARGYWQIKIYNSMNPAWVPAITKLAHSLGMGVTGHVPAFTNADAMIAAGYDEVTHINQLMLGWVLKPEEDTRTPLRLTAMKRTADLDLGSARVRKTVTTMANRKIALDPTAVTLELLMTGRDGKPNPAVAEYFDHLPVGTQRQRLQAIAPIQSPADAAAYDGAMVKVREVLKLLHGSGIRLLPGTDEATGLSVHRELEIYRDAGIPVADVLRLATLGCEEYLGRADRLGTIARGKQADFLLLPGNPLDDLAQLHRIAMVVKDGTIYFPSEIYPEFGIKPFADKPAMTLPAPTAPAATAGAHSHDPADEFLF